LEGKGKKAILKAAAFFPFFLITVLWEPGPGVMKTQLLKLPNISKHAFEVGQATSPMIPSPPKSHLFDGQAVVDWDSEI
jgi:hypothetical protein